jgi:hypothetical protein
VLHPFLSLCNIASLEPIPDVPINLVKIEVNTKPALAVAPDVTAMRPRSDRYRREHTAIGPFDVERGDSRVH